MNDTLNTHNTELRFRRFEDAWLNWRTGDPMPDWRQHLPANDEPCNRKLIAELLGLDIECRIKAGLSALLAERYFDHPRLQLPDARLDDAQRIELIHWEYQQRWQKGQRIQRTDYESAFPQYADALRQLKPRSTCPRCRRTIELDESDQTIRCPHCETEPSLATIPRFVPPLSPPTEPATRLDLRGYELIEQLGRGGMGAVYRAVDPALERDLAIKVISDNYRGHPEVERRFLREARITGSLQHPGIVPIHNLGRLADGRLHYTMRLVRGRTFAAILKEEAGRSERWPELLTIFVKICQAVAYAHSKRVIHRDLKPSNVMVGKFGEVQVMDWGLAKLLPEGERGRVSAPSVEDHGGTRIHTESADASSELTRMGSGIGTPAYMPPEQALGEWDRVDERSDVFALGAILCEILTGAPPHVGSDGEEVYRRAKRGDVADALARLQQCGADAALTDLCRACLSSEREGRPRDAGMLSQAVAAYQSEVQARLQRAEVERERAVVKAQEERKRRRLAVGSVLLLLLAVVIAVWQAVRATSFAKAEAAQRKQTEAANTILASIFRDLDPRTEEKGGPTLRQQLSQHLERAAAQLDEAAAGDPVAIARLQDTLGQSLISFGQAPRAIELLSKAGATREAKLGADHPDTLTTLNNLAEAYRTAGQLDKALRLHQQILDKRKAKLEDDHADMLTSANNLALAYMNAGQLDKALPLFEQTLNKQKAKLGDDHPDTLNSMSNLAEAYRTAGQLDKALALHRQTLEKRKAKLGADHPDTLTSMNSLAAAYRDARQPDKALLLWKQTLDKRKAKLGDDHPATLRGMNNLAAAYWDAGQRDEALPLWEQTLDKMKAKLGADHPNTLQSMNSLASAYQATGQRDKALPLFVQTLDKRKATLGADHPDTLATMNSLAAAYWTAGKLDRSVPLFEETLKLRKTKLGADHADTLLTMANLGVNYRDAGRFAEAIALLETALQRGRQRPGGLPPELTRTTPVLPHLAETYFRAGQFAKAEPIYRDFLQQAQERFGADDLRTAAAMAPLAANLLKQKKFADAETVLGQCLTIREKKQPDAWTTFNTRSTLGEALAGQKKYKEAEPLLVQGYEGMKQRQDKIPPPYRKLRLTEARQRLVQLYDAWGKKEQANIWRKTPAD